MVHPLGKIEGNNWQQHANDERKESEMRNNIRTIKLILQQSQRKRARGREASVLRQPNTNY